MVADPFADEARGRAERMNYLDKIAAEIQRTAHPSSTPPDEDLPLYRLYAILLLAKGQDVTLEDVHNAWVAWASDHHPESRHLIPFKELSLPIQRKDQKYVEAIREVAEQLRVGD
ncbi:MAG: hypothetical protein M3P70_05980 [Actinomycetota bacterium]|nr:hypothetical protein [Actinomycetota bacterium]